MNARREEIERAGFVPLWLTLNSFDRLRKGPYGAAAIAVFTRLRTEEAAASKSP